MSGVFRPSQVRRPKGALQRCYELPLSFFNDCDELDDCEAAISLDGRTGTFLAWGETSDEPISLLCDSERELLEQILKSVYWYPRNLEVVRKITLQLILKSRPLPSRERKRRKRLPKS
jgi:hypothetical protein